MSGALRAASDSAAVRGMTYVAPARPMPRRPKRAWTYSTSTPSAYITPRYSADEVESALGRMQARIRELEAKLREP